MPTAAPWAVLLCKFSDDDLANPPGAEPAPLPVSYYEDLFTTAGLGTYNVVDFFQAVSFGTLDLSGSQVFGWLSLTHSRADAAAAGRGVIFEWARAAAAQANINVNLFAGIVVCLPWHWQTFGISNRHEASLDQYGLAPSVSAQEIGHGFGLAHSRAFGSSDDYTDLWDTMSTWSGPAGSVLVAPNAKWGSIGPFLNAANIRSQGWLPESRVWKGEIPAGGLTKTLRPLTRPDLPGWLALDLPSTLTGAEDPVRVLIELRIPTGWDAHFPLPLVLAHYFLPDGHSYTVRNAAGKTALTAGDILSLGGVQVYVGAIDANPTTASASLFITPLANGSSAGAASPSGTSWGANRLDVFVRGTDDTLYTKSWNGNAWSPYAQLGVEHFRGSPAAVSWGPNRIDVFVRGTDDTLYTKSWNGNAWSPYAQLGVEHFRGSPAAVSWGPNRIDVFVRGTDDTLYTKSWNGNAWSPYAQLGVEQISASPAAASWGANRIDVFVRGTDDRLYTKSWNGNAWSPYAHLGMEQISASPAAVSWGANRIDVFVRGTDYGLYTKSWNGNAWSGYTRLGPEQFFASPSAAAWGPNRIDVFVHGTDDTLYTKSWNGNVWSGYSQLGNNKIA